MGLSAVVTSSADAFHAALLRSASNEGGLEGVHVQFRASAREQATASELGPRQANVLAHEATRSFHENASVKSRDGCQRDERSGDAHLSAETRDGDWNAKTLAD